MTRALLFSILLASKVMASDTTMTGPMCSFHTKVKDGVTGFNCTSNQSFLLIIDGKKAETFDHCDSAVTEYKDTTWYAPCKSLTDWDTAKTFILKPLKATCHKPK